MPSPFAVLAELLMMVGGFWLGFRMRARLLSG